MHHTFPIPSEEQLENLGAGCFVQVSGRNSCFWVEIDGEQQDGRLTGVVHPELADEQCPCATSDERVTFTRDQVKYVGCDRYCFC